MMPFHQLSPDYDVVPETSRSGTPKKIKRTPNPLVVYPLSALSQDISARYPTELHDYIIDYLHNDKYALFACSLVCRAWSTSSRYQLFQNACTIRVHRGNFREFCELLASQRLNDYIGRLHLQSHLIQELSEGRVFEWGPNERFQFNHHLQRLSCLPRLKYLLLDYHHDDVHPEFLNALANNFATVTELEFTSMHFTSFAQFVQMVDSLPLLRRVTLDGVLFYDCRYHNNPEDDNPEPTFMPGNLTDVVANCGYDSTAPVLSWLLSQPLIRRLAVSIEQQHREEHTALLSDVLRALGPRLEYLVLKDADNTHLPDLSQTTGLHAFRITGIRCLRTSSSADLEWVLALISELHSPNLQRIVFVVDLRERTGLDLFDWPRIRELFARLSSLRRVSFHLSGHSKWASKAIAEHLAPRAYTLRVAQLVGRYQYSLNLFEDN
ncbi:hypothetical protein K438DRAFT_1747287 [Mycena galopus ATCC 62051]|nr:hypothetical protein K438DRAFT_1747287 [Mycena galopus ATCC 62051]